VGLEAATHQLGATGRAVKAVIAASACLSTWGVLGLVEAARSAVIAAFEAFTTKAITLRTIALKAVVLSTKATVVAATRVLLLPSALRALLEARVVAGFEAGLLTATVLAWIKAGFKTLATTEVVAAEITTPALAFKAVTATVAPTFGLAAEAAIATEATVAAATFAAALATKRLAWVVKALLGLQAWDHFGLERLLKRAKEEGRADDTADVIRRRLELYHQRTEPMLDYYRQQGILEEVNGERPIEKIHQDIMGRLKK